VNRFDEYEFLSIVIGMASQSLVIDIGGDIYHLGSESSINFIYTDRNKFMNTFKPIQNEKKQITMERIKELLTRYFPYSIASKPDAVISFDKKKDREDVLFILNARLRQLKNSLDQNSSTLIKNSLRTYSDNLETIIKTIESSKSVRKNSKPIVTPTKLSNNDIFQLILEFAWYLNHPDKIPEELANDWEKLSQNLLQSRLGDIVQLVNEEKKKVGSTSSENPLNYFEQINLKEIIVQNTLQNAIGKTKNQIVFPDTPSAKSNKELIRRLVLALEMKKYTDQPTTMNPSGYPMINPNSIKKIEKHMIANPMAGGNQSTLDLPLSIAMKPLFDYFKVVYDPIYSMLENSMSKYMLSKNTNKTHILPQLLTLLEVCNRLPENKYGVYHIKNIDKNVLGFYKVIIQHTKMEMNTLVNDDEKEMFRLRLFKLPKVRLSRTRRNTTYYKKSSEIPYIQFFIVDENLTLPKEKNFLNVPTHSVEMYNAMNQFFKPSELYIVVADSSGVINTDIPMNVYEIDYNAVDIQQGTVPVDELKDNYFNQPRDDKPELYLDQLVTIDNNGIFNNAELSLSVFIALKEYMPSEEEKSE
jgi:hypothetical protein